MTRQGDKRVMAKSLHTVTVLVRVARSIKARTGNADAVCIADALGVLGLVDQIDAHGITAAALHQLGTGAR